MAKSLIAIKLKDFNKKRGKKLREVSVGRMIHLGVRLIRSNLLSRLKESNLLCDFLVFNKQTSRRVDVLLRSKPKLES